MKVCVALKLSNVADDLPVNQTHACHNREGFRDLRLSFGLMLCLRIYSEWPAQD